MSDSPDDGAPDAVVSPDLLKLLDGTASPPGDVQHASAVQTLAALGFLPTVPASPAVPAVSVQPLGLMNPADETEQTIPPALLRTSDADEAMAARGAQAGQPVLPAGLPQHPGAPSTIPASLLRPEDTTSPAAQSRPSFAAPPTPTVQDPQAFAAAYQHIVANAKDPQHPTDAEMASALEAANSETATLPKQARGPLQPVPDLPLEQADAQDMDARARAQQSQLEAQRSAGQAVTEHALHLSQIDATESRDMERTDGAFRVMRQAAEMKAADETHQWMTKIDDITRKEPDPGRMFTGEGGGMRRALWFAAMMGNAIVNRKHPERANTAMQMLMHEIDQDVSLQKDQQSKELQAANLKHQSAQADAARATADLRDDRSQQLTRILTVGRLLRDKAAVPGPADQKAANLAAAAALDQQAAKLAGDYHKEALDSRNKELDRQKDFALAGIRERAATDRAHFEQSEQNYRQFKEQQYQAKEGPLGQAAEAAEARKEGREFTNKALLAPITEQAKAEGAQKAGEAPLNTTLGLNAVDTAGKPVPLTLRKEDRVKAGEVVARANKTWEGYNRLDKLLADVKDSDFIAGSPKLDSAKNQLAALVGQDLHPGRMSDVAVKLGESVSSGISTSWQGRAAQDVRGQLDEIRSLIKQRLGAMPQEVPGDVAPYTHGNERLLWSPPQLEGTESPVPTGKDINAAYGVPSSAGTGRPYSVTEFEEIQAGKRQAPPLGPTGDQAVKDAVDAFGWGSKSSSVPAGKLPDDIRALAKAAEERVRKEGHASAYDAGNAPIPAALRDDAANRIELAAQQALNAANAHMHTLLKPGFSDSSKYYSFDTFLDAAEKEGGFNTKDAEVRNGLRREYDKFHDKAGDIDDHKLAELLKATEERFK